MVAPPDAARYPAPPERARSPVLGGVRDLIRDLGALAVPVDCAGCDAPDVSLCGVCRALLGAPPRRCESDAIYLAPDDGPGRAALGLPTWALAPYAASTRRVVLAWKSHARADIAPTVLGAAQHAGARLANQLAWSAGVGTLVLVPAPSGWRRRVARRFVVGDLADALGRGLAHGFTHYRTAAGQQAAPSAVGHLGTEVAPREVVVLDLLRRAGGTEHHLGAAARGRERTRAMRVVAPPPPGAACLLVDDVVTTGATLAASRAALQAAGLPVIGAFAFAATPRPGTSTWR